ncbi:MAG: hypothetical protein ACYC5Q_06085 [Thermoleophilia bacterium]
MARTTNGGTRFLAVLALVVALPALMAAPALAAPNPPAAPGDGLYTAHCATMGTPGHAGVPFTCTMPHDECMGLTI